MGEAKKRKQMAMPTVYHHTSTLRTNLLWMSGVIEVEGKGGSAFHPHFGEIGLNSSLRRGMQDFNPLAWFTTQISTPKCILNAAIHFTDKNTGEPRDLPVEPRLPNAVALQRIAIGFPIDRVPIVPWPQHAGYQTDEGAVLNESARDFGDNPDDWYVAEQAVDLLAASEFWASRSIMKPKLERFQEYLPDMRRMVELCRSTPGVYIPPSWLTLEQGSELGRRLGREPINGIPKAALI